MKTTLFCSFLFLLLSAKSQGQAGEYFRVSLTTESISIPFTELPLRNVGIEISSSLTHWSGKHTEQQIWLTAGLFHHKDFTTHAYLLATFRQGVVIGQQVGFHYEAGLGYQHLFYAPDTYEFEAGRFKAPASYSKPSLAGKINLQLSYEGLDQWKPFLGYGGYVTFPFVEGYAPILPNTQFQTGVLLSLNR